MTTKLPQKKLKLGQVPTPTPRVFGKATAFPYYDKEEHKHDGESEEAAHLEFMGLAAFHAKDVVPVKVPNILFYFY